MSLPTVTGYRGRPQTTTGCSAPRGIPAQARPGNSPQQTQLQPILDRNSLIYTQSVPRPHISRCFCSCILRGSCRATCRSRSVRLCPCDTQSLPRPSGLQAASCTPHTCLHTHPSDTRSRRTVCSERRAAPLAPLGVGEWWPSASC